MKNTLAALALASLTALGCNSDALSGTGIDPNGNGDGGDGGMSGNGDGGFNADAACGVVNAKATLSKAPVDVIVVVDNSMSMSQEIVAVQNNINANFAQILANSGLDYRVIVIGNHGDANVDQSICISPPLATANVCSPLKAAPSFGPHFYQYSREIASNDSLTLILSTFGTNDSLGGAPGGWKTWLRPGAVKTFIEVTDDNSNGIAYTKFDTDLLALSPAQFGTAAKRNYIFHSIVGLAAKTVVTDAYQPNEPIQTTQCPTAAGGGAAGSVYQNLSKLTGGLRYPVCETANYDAVFKAVAQGVVTGTTLACDFPVPAAPPGKTFILTTAQLKYTPGNGGAVQYFNQVSDLGQCAANSFYIQGSQIYLCPTSCTTVKADNKADLALALDCSQVIG